MSSSVLRSRMISSLLKMKKNTATFRRVYSSESNVVAGAPKKEPTMSSRRIVREKAARTPQLSWLQEIQRTFVVAGGFSFCVGILFRKTYGSFLDGMDQLVEDLQDEKVILKYLNCFAWCTRFSVFMASLNI